MVKLRRVTESLDHVELLMRYLQSLARDPQHWYNEWSVNPYYMVDLGHYGLGSCVCGHPIRYQFQFLNTVTGQTLPVGSVCVKQLHLAPLDEAVERLEVMNQMARQDLDESLDSREFVKEYKKYYPVKGFDALKFYNLYTPDPTNLFIYKNCYNKRTLERRYADIMKQMIIDMHDKAESFVNQIERKSKPVSQQQVQNLVSSFTGEPYSTNPVQKTLFG